MVFTLLGMELFAFRLKFNGSDEFDMETGISPRSNFDTFLDAFTTVFQILMGDGWEAIVYNSIRARGYLMLIYYIFLIIFG